MGFTDAGALAFRDKLLRDYPDAPEAPQPNGDKPMKFQFKLDLANLANALSATTRAAQTTESGLTQLYAFGAKMIAIVEKAYGDNAGVSKKAAVIAAASAFIGAAENTNLASALPEFDNWIEVVIAAWNAANETVNTYAPQEVAQAPVVESKVETLISEGENLAAQIAPAVKVAETLFAPISSATSAINTQGI
jgi:hypothetical protein